MSNQAPLQAPHESEIEQKRAKRLQDVSKYAPRHVGAFQRAYKGKSRKSAIQAYCVDCMGFNASEVKHCTSPACPLFEFRSGRAR